MTLDKNQMNSVMAIRELASPTIQASEEESCALFENGMIFALKYPEYARAVLTLVNQAKHKLDPSLIPTEEEDREFYAHMELVTQTYPIQAMPI